MAKQSGPNAAQAPQMLRLLTWYSPARYKFSTNEPGRPSTLYFQDGVGARGRFRRGHGLGSQLIFQGRCKRIFVSPDLKRLLGTLSGAGLDGDDFNAVSYGKFMAKLSEIQGVLERGGGPGGLYEGRASLRVVPGWHVFDNDGESGHCSSGTVMGADATAAAVLAGAGLTVYAGAYSIW